MDDKALASAREALASGKFAEAAKILEPLHRRWPKHAETAHALALAFAQMGMKEKAMPLFEAAVALAPDDATLHLNFGAALSQLGRGAEALRELRKAVELAPKMSGAHYNLAVELSKSGDLAAAATAMREAARLNPDAGVFQRELARIEGQLGRWDAAIEAYRACVASEECHLDAKTELALALEKAGRGDEALAAWASLVEMAPLLPTARHHLVSALAAKGDLDRAESVAAAGTEADPANADFWHNLGAIRAMKGDAAGAVAAYRRALLADPARPDTALEASSALEAPAPNAEVEHANPFAPEEEHRAGVLTFRARSGDDLSRALAHAIPALLAASGKSGAATARHVAPMRRGEPRRADVFFDYFDRASSHMASLTRSLKAERWVFGEIAPDLAALRVRLWTAGSANEQERDFPLDPREPAAAIREAAAFAGVDLAPLPDPKSLLHFGLGATAVVDDLALDHLLAALRPAPFPLAETEFLARTVDVLRRGEAPLALEWLERALAIRPSGRVLFAKAQALFASGQYDPAREAWTEAARLDPSLRPPPLPMGWLDMKAGNLEAAEANFRAATEEPEDAGAGLVGLGCVLLARKNDVEGARKLFLEALEKSPRLPEALFQIAMTYVSQGNRAEAERWAGRLEAHHEGHPLVLTLARVLGRA